MWIYVDDTYAESFAQARVRLIKVSSISAIEIITRYKSAQGDKTIRHTHEIVEGYEIKVTSEGLQYTVSELQENMPNQSIEVLMHHLHHDLGIAHDTVVDIRPKSTGRPSATNNRYLEHVPFLEQTWSDKPVRVSEAD